MPNDYFRFKQFTIYQSRCAMNVTMDACIFGAWANVPASARRVLDVGAGTGLLSLMLAQRFPQLHIDAIELVAEAAVQAQENVAASPFADRIDVFNADARTFIPEERYDALICNPPFFSKSMTAPKMHRALARHDGQFTFDDLQEIIDRVLEPDGTAFVLLPASRMREWMGFGIARGWSTEHFCALWSHQGDKKGRAFFAMKRGEVELTTSHLFACVEPGGALSAEVSELLRPFYLKL